MGQSVGQDSTYSYAYLKYTHFIEISMPYAHLTPEFSVLLGISCSDQGFFAGHEKTSNLKD